MCGKFIKVLWIQVEACIQGIFLLVTFIFNLRSNRMDAIIIFGKRCLLNLI